MSDFRATSSGRVARYTPGYGKSPVLGRCRVDRLNLDGDGQGDLAGHGGEQRAVFVYQIESYRYWQEQLKRTDFVHGQFGENFTIEGLPDDAVCIGDRYQIGSALFEVTQPRVTCYRVGIRMNEPRMPALLTSSGRPGFYFRVLREGEVGAGDEIVKVGEANGANDRGGGQCAALFAQPSTRSTGARVADRSAFARMALVLRGVTAEPIDGSGERQRRADAGSRRASGCAGISPAGGDGDRSRVRGRALADDAERGRSAAANGTAGPVRGHASSADARRPATLSQLFALGSAVDGALSDQREDRAEWSGRKLSAGTCPGRRYPRRQFAARKLHSAVRTNGRWCCSARGSGRRRFWRCCTRWRRRTRHGRSCGCTPLGTGSIIPLPPKFAASCSPSPNGRSYVCYSRPGSHDRMGEDFDATGHLSRSVLDKAGVSRDADVYLCGPTRFMADMKAALAALGMAPERIHVEIFNGASR